MKTATLFTNGRSQAVRLPKDCRFTARKSSSASSRTSSSCFQACPVDTLGKQPQQVLN
jgi:hypothetical protein